MPIKSNARRRLIDLRGLSCSFTKDCRIQEVHRLRHLIFKLQRELSESACPLPCHAHQVDSVLSSRNSTGLPPF
jgi:hypothetical protein